MDRSWKVEVAWCSPDRCVAGCLVLHDIGASSKEMAEDKAVAYVRDKEYARPEDTLAAHAELEESHTLILSAS